MGNIVRTAVTLVECYGNFINSDSPIVTDSLLDLLFHGLSCHTLRCSSVLYCIVLYFYFGSIKSSTCQ